MGFEMFSIKPHENHEIPHKSPMNPQETSKAQCGIPHLQRPLRLLQRLLRQPQAALRCLRCPQRWHLRAAERGKILCLRGKGRASDLQLLGSVEAAEAPKMDGTHGKNTKKHLPFC